LGKRIEKEVPSGDENEREFSYYLKSIGKTWREGRSEKASSTPRKRVMYFKP